MEELIEQQKRLRGSLEKAYRNYKKDGPSKRSEQYFQKRLTMLTEDWTEYKNNDKQILAIKTETDEKERPYFKNDWYTETKELYIDIYSKIEEDYHKVLPVSDPLAKADQSTEFNISHSAHHDDEVKLPRISLPTFSGDYASWPSFFDLFSNLVHKKTSISRAQKLQYLKAHLIGEAKSLLSNTLISDANYEPAWKLLIETYDNKRALLKTQLDLLTNQPKLTRETAQGIKALKTKTNECLTAIENLEITTTNWDPILVHLIVQKLPPESHELWEQSQSSKSRRIIPTWAELREFLEARFRTLEAIRPTSSRESRPREYPGQRAQTFHVTSNITCILCQEAHPMRKCPKYTQMDTEERYRIVGSKGLCINCLGTRHRAAQCTSKIRCFRCGGTHHTTLHRFQQLNQRNNPTTQTKEPQPEKEAAKFQTQSYFSQELPQEPQQVLLATALVTVISPNGLQQTCRALIDPGSQATFVRETVVQSLHLTKEAIQTNVSGLGSMPAGKITSRVTLNLKTRHPNEDIIRTQALVLNKLTNSLPTMECSPKGWTHLKGLQLADPTFNQPGHIDILLGADVFPMIILDGIQKGNKGSPVAQNTVFGWIVSGKTAPQSQRNITVGTFFTQVQLDNDLKKFWELEELPSKPAWTREETLCEQHFANNVIRRTDGRYQVRLPLQTDQSHLQLGASRHIAISRLLQMEKRFEQDLLLKTEYIKCMREYLALEHMVPANTPEAELRKQAKNGNNRYECCYLPHHAVLKPSSTTTKVRVVFDASRPTTSGKSLNNLLLNGPIIQESLMSTLMRWRKHQVAYMADIEKMYRQIRIHPADTDYQRIVWRESPDQPIRDYKLLTVTFGTKSAPFLAIRTMHQLANDEAEAYPLGSNAVLNDFYVDDLMSGADTIKEAKIRQFETIRLLQSAGLQLRKWAANHDEILKGVPETDREISFPLALNPNEVKALGLLWNPTKDTLSYKVDIEPHPETFTKRKILSEIAKLFDPIGWLTPITITAKILIQNLWLLKLDWDELVPPTIEEHWRKFRTSLHSIQAIQITRWIRMTSKSQAIELHGFCDASTKAYAASVYMRTQDEDGNFHCTLIAAKSKVAPIKTISLPRLELCGANLLARLLAQIKRDMKLEHIQTHAWSDSTIVISWLRKHPSSWETFIANRVSNIHQLLDQVSWSHVRTDENPADCATRGITPDELKQHQLWWNGPWWLTQPKEVWPKPKEISETTIGQRKTTTNLHIETNQSTYDLLHRFSSLSKLLRVTAYCRRWLKLLEPKPRAPAPTYLSSNEIQEAHAVWIRNSQKHEFQTEVKQLEAKQALPSKSRLLKLTPFLDQEGIMRVGGRLSNSSLTFSERHPIILPEKGPLTKLIIDNVHRSTMHGGTQLMLNMLRQRYWILHARKAVKSHNHNCMRCFRQVATGRTQLMANLPEYRVRPASPFAHTGIDYCGPFNLKLSKTRGAKIQKGYIALFICMTTKAIHIEIVTDMSTNGFLAAFRRFVSRRGLCNNIYTDCGSNFIGANGILTRHKVKANQALENELAEALENEGIRWHFIPPASPHFGGLWESGVKSTKYHLKRIMGETTLTYEELSTLTAQIEAALNSRPLSEITQDPDDMTALTPGHFLVGRPLLTPPEPCLLDTNINRLDRYQYIQRLYQNFWTRWSTEYLSRLQQRPKWLQSTSELKINDLVLIKDERLPPSRWLLGRIIETHPGSDKLIRVVTIRTQHNTMKRPITKVCRLPNQNEENRERGKNPNTTNPEK